MNAAVDAFFSVRLGSILLEGFRRDIAAPIKARIGSLEKRLTKIAADEERLKRYAERQHEGELLKANLRLAKKGMSGIAVMDWNTSQKRTVSLDPALSPIENMEQIFKKSAKGKRGESSVRERLKQTLEEKRALEDLLFFVSEAEDIGELELLIGDSHSRDSLQSTLAAKKNQPSGQAESHLFRSMSSPSGATILVGKSGKGNAFLLRKKANKGDLWFHVKDLAGAHVLLKKQTLEPPSTADMEFAAGVAVHFSKAKGKGKVEVMIADVNDLGHKKGAVPGQVTVRSYKTMLSEGLSTEKE